MNPSLVGRTLGHYRVTSELGAGGMGVVYRAQDLKLGRQVALKVLPSTAADDPDAVERFRREARTASSLNHPNICTIYAFEEIEGQLVLAMELLDGETLDRRFGGQLLDLPQLLDVGIQIADALDAAHVEGVLHRDIKPANIFVTRRGQLKVLDFGLAKLAPGHRRAANRAGQQTAQHFESMAGTTVGTIAYMSPEQARGQELDQRTDLFSFGVVLYELATGRQSFPGATTAVIFDGILNHDPTPPSSINPSLPPDLDRVIAKALEKERDLRYQTAADLRADLQRLRRDSGTRRAFTPSQTHVDPTAATVVLPAASGGAEPAVASAPVSPVIPGTPSALSASRHLSAASAIVRQHRWPIGLAGGAIAIAVLAAMVGAFVATRGAQRVEGDEAAPVEAVVVEEAPAVEPAPAIVPPAEAPAAVPVTSAPEPAPVNHERAESTRLLQVARNKVESKLLDQALVDLRQIQTEFPTSRAAADASLLSAEVLEQLGRVDDAMAAHVEFGTRFARDPRAPASKLQHARLLLKGGRNREPAALDVLGEIITGAPRTPEALAALQMRIRLENDRRGDRVPDAELGIDVPPVVFTLRQQVAQFPTAPQTMLALNRLATTYMDLRQHAAASSMLETLLARFPDSPLDAAFRLGELYERQLNDRAKARTAYQKVAEGSTRYAEAQRRLERLQ